MRYSKEEVEELRAGHSNRQNPVSMLPILAWRTRPKNSFEMLTVLVTLILPVAAQIRMHITKTNESTHPDIDSLGSPFLVGSGPGFPTSDSGHRLIFLRDTWIRVYTSEQEGMDQASVEQCAYSSWTGYILWCCEVQSNLLYAETALACEQLYQTS